MKPKGAMDVLSEDQGSVASTLTVIEALCEELREGKLDDWENPDLLPFLEAMHAWLETMGPRVGERPTWTFIQALIYAAKVYE